jgi:hypothetical protein
MSDDIRQMASEVLRILHGARALPPAEAADALVPFLDLMRRQGSTDTLASASVAAVTKLSQSLNDNHTASDDLWQEQFSQSSTQSKRVLSRSVISAVFFMGA